VIHLTILSMDLNGKVMNKVLVFDGRSRAALSIIRSLGKKGVFVIVGEAFKCSSFYSKYTKQIVIYPSPKQHKEEFVAFIIKFLRDNSIDVIIPVRDDINEIIINNKAVFSELTSFVVPSIKAFNSTRDKAETIKLCRALSVPHPKTVLSNVEDFSLKKLKKIFNLPVLIKPRISSGSRGIAVISVWSEFENTYRSIHDEFPYPMIQEFIPHGGAYGVSMLYKDGNAKASFTHKRVREYPLSGGPSTLREGVRYLEIEKYAADLLSNLEWNGVAMVEYRIDSRTKEPKFMEINPRFWGSLQTAVYSGIDFPNLLYKLALNSDCENNFKYESGKQVRWLLFGDILWFLSSKKNIKNIKLFFTFIKKNQSYDIFSWKDLGPTYGLFKEAFCSILRSDRRKHVFKRGW
jgi:predicted ATP-grasp superfamily ATP-dependent carboligase